MMMMMMPSSTTRDPTDTFSPFLSLPTELRCYIYDYLLSESQAVTISAGYATILGHRIQDLKRKQDIPGLPLEFAPLVRPHFDASLLSAAKPPTVAIDHDGMGDVQQETNSLVMPAPMALRLSCRMINDEVMDYMRARQYIKTTRASSIIPVGSKEDTSSENQEGLSLYVTYPYGILVLKSMYPYLLAQAKRVYISGYHTSTSKPPTPPHSPSSSADEETDSQEHLTPSTSIAITHSFTTTTTTSFPNNRQPPHLPRNSTQRPPSASTPLYNTNPSFTPFSRLSPTKQIPPPHPSYQTSSAPSSPQHKPPSQNSPSASCTRAKTHTAPCGPMPIVPSRRFCAARAAAKSI
ncbi:hypothetical protein GQ44DRAFT_401469 [Phaeosphaeriaceae sp. PMI808]|nr:hypothetical protein GQ44DRAFT_401469 [Phaeosphaeriaceae sp. PMI808]